MKLLVVVSNYPHPGHRFSGIFNQRSVEALKEDCELITVLAPRPYAPAALARIVGVRRWEAYAEAKSVQLQNGVAVHRPPYLQIPRFATNFWQEKGAYLCAVWRAQELNARHKFDAILAFGLDGSAGVGWRLGRRLKIPVAVWATGTDIRKPKGTTGHECLLKTLANADLVICQSRELSEIAERITKAPFRRSSSTHRVVLPRGVPEPPILPRDELRGRERAALGVGDGEILVLSVSRVTRAKGMFELLDAMSLVSAKNSNIKCVIVGSKPSFDEADLVEAKLNASPNLRSSIKLLPACDPDKVWEYLCAADIFAFPSHNEGMPNSLLEAMVMGVPSIAFAIPPILELEAGTGAVALVPALDAALFSKAILRLSSSKDERGRMAAIGKGQIMERFMIRKNMKKACAHLARVVEERAQTREAIPEAKDRSAILGNYDVNH